MDISSLKARQAGVEVIGEIIEVSPPRVVTTTAGETQVSSAKLKDATGVIVLSLWNDQVGKLAVGDKIKITNGYVGEFRGELQLSTGKFGALKVMETSKGVVALASPQPAQQSPVKGVPPSELDDAKEAVIPKPSSSPPAKSEGDPEEGAEEESTSSGDPELPDYEIAKPVPPSQQTRPADIDYPDVEEERVKDE